MCQIMKNMMVLDISLTIYDGTAQDVTWRDVTWRDIVKTVSFQAA